MTTKKKTLIALMATLMLLPAVIYCANSPDGEPCTIDRNCLSRNCHDDYNTSNGMFCADNTFSCVHLEDGNTVATIYADGSTSENYECNHGTWVTDDADGDGVLDSVDTCPSTDSSCTVSNGLINPSDGCPYRLYDFTTNLEDYDNETCIVGSFGVLAEPLCGQDPSTLVTYTLGSVEKNTCNTTGDTLWPWPSDHSKHMCPIEDLSSPGSGIYTLYAEYDIDGVPVSETISSIIVNEDCETDIPCSMGTFLNDSLPSTIMSLTLSDSYSKSGNTYITYPDTEVSLTDIASVQLECSNGDPVTRSPGVVGWVYYNGEYTWLSINNGYKSLEGRCIGRTIERQDLIGSTSQTTGYFPETSCSSPLISGTTTSTEYTNSYILSDGGDYEIVADIVNAHCVCPTSYICPWTDSLTRTELCKVSTMSTPEFMTGWKNYDTYSIKVISPSVSLDPASVEQEYEVSDPYDPTEEKAVVWEIVNNGTGDIILSDISVSCPPTLTCSSPAVTTINIPEGSDASIVSDFILPCRYSENEYGITLTYRITDAYGIRSASDLKTLTATIILVNQSDDSSAACECYAGSTANWDDNYGCCDPGDCWSTDDANRICHDGEWVEGTTVCESYTLCGQEWYWDGNKWLTKIPEGCSCYSSDQCSNCTCIDGICMDLESPDIHFDEGSDGTVYLGETIDWVVVVRNNLPVKDTVTLSISTDPERLEYWSSFSDDGTEVIVDLSAGEERSIPLNIFCGEKGTYEMTLVAESAVSSGLKSSATRMISVVATENGLRSESPGLTILSLAVILIIAAVYQHSRKKVTKKSKKKR